MNEPKTPFWENPSTQDVFDDCDERHKRRIQHACREMIEHLSTLTNHPDVQAASELRSLVGLLALNVHRITDAVKEMP